MQQNTYEKMSKHFWPDKQTLLEILKCGIWNVIHSFRRHLQRPQLCPLTVKMLKHTMLDTQKSVTLMQHFSLLFVIMLILIRHKDLI